MENTHISIIGPGRVCPLGKCRLGIFICRINGNGEVGRISHTLSSGICKISSIWIAFSTYQINMYGNKKLFHCARGCLGFCRLQAWRYCLPAIRFSHPKNIFRTSTNNLIGSLLQCMSRLNSQARPRGRKHHLLESRVPILNPAVPT